MRLSVEIDSDSGFCGGVIRAINKAQECLEDGGALYSLGAIVHNESELKRLESLGMVTLDAAGFEKARGRGRKLLIRAHGEPPRTYALAAEKGFEVIDCTCPVVLKLQRDIRAAREGIVSRGDGGQIVIFGKAGHAEVNGLVGQVGAENAVVIEAPEQLDGLVSDGKIDLSRPVEVFSQTTKNPAGYSLLCERLRALGARVTVHNTICSQVASRQGRMAEFARGKDVIVFVAGADSSNGKVLCGLCRENNPRTHMIGSPEEVDASWFRDGDRVGICGATSTPKWLLEEVSRKIWQLSD